MKKSVNYKKMPYFQTQVVKVRKQVCHHENVVCKNGTIRCKDCGRYLKIECEKPKGGIGIWGFSINKNIQPKGNWIHGENLDKIKFPVLCRYTSVMGTKHGMINKDLSKYTLVDISEQSEVNVVWDYEKLEELIREKDIHILKGKIVIFENEEGD